MCSLCGESVSLGLHWQQQNRRGNRKGLRSLVLGRISSFGGVPPPPSLNSPSLYLFFMVPPNTFSSRCGINSLAELESKLQTSILLLCHFWGENTIWGNYVLAWRRRGWGQLRGEVLLTCLFDLCVPVIAAASLWFLVIKGFRILLCSWLCVSRYHSARGDFDKQTWLWFRHGGVLTSCWKTSAGVKHICLFYQVKTVISHTVEKNQIMRNVWKEDNVHATFLIHFVVHVQYWVLPHWAGRLPWKWLL